MKENSKYTMSMYMKQNSNGNLRFGKRILILSIKDNEPISKATC